jgi:hypothetical protein
MITDKLKELAATREKVAALEESLAADLKKELAALPARYGFKSAAAFTAAVRAAGGKPRKRVIITDAMRAKVKKFVEDGKTGREIMELLDISMPSVHNIKKELGLVWAQRKL